ncbi:MAG: Uma2 family endonuclease [Methylococcaceae bacterium]|nr:Uma2 family endonuclease [Methylococcaceae bacterium]
MKPVTVRAINETRTSSPCCKLERKLKKGVALTECSVQTTEGVKVADVAWCSKAFIKEYDYATPYIHAPENSIEVVSPSNSKVEMRNKVSLYLAAGAIEAWVVWENGVIDYYDNSGKLEQSSYNISVKIPVV